LETQRHQIFVLSLRKIMVGQKTEGLVPRPPARV